MPIRCAGLAVVTLLLASLCFAQAVAPPGPGGRPGVLVPALVGAMPDEAEAAARAGELARNARLAIPRAPGLYGAFAFGSRGLLWSALAAEVLAARVEGAAPPLERDLLESIDPARFLSRSLRARPRSSAR